MVLAFFNAKKGRFSVSTGTLQIYIYIHIHRCHLHRQMQYLNFKWTINSNFTWYWLFSMQKRKIFGTLQVLYEQPKQKFNFRGFSEYRKSGFWKSSRALCFFQRKSTGLSKCSWWTGPGALDASNPRGVSAGIAKRNQFSRLQRRPKTQNWKKCHNFLLLAK